MKKKLLVQVCIVVFMSLLLSSCQYIIGTKNIDQSEPILQNETLLTVEQMLQTILPKDRLLRVGEIKQESDGFDGTLAFVEPINEDGSKWFLAYDKIDIYNEELTKYNNLKDTLTTMVHEYFHIESLNDTQVRHNKEDLQDGEMLLEEGCAKKDAYLTLFTKEFWSDEEVKNAKENEGNDDFSSIIYEKRPDDFVDEYAATNQVEDFAESFAYFVMQDKIEDSSKIKNKKMQFFNRFPEFIELKKHMRKGIDEILKSQKDNDLNIPVER